jgi:hypothetical protein
MDNDDDDDEQLFNISQALLERSRHLALPLLPSLDNFFLDSIDEAWKCLYFTQNWDFCQDRRVHEAYAAIGLMFCLSFTCLACFPIRRSNG